MAKRHFLDIYAQKKSTWRFKYDRNANVDSDLVFWERFLSKGEQIINIGDSNVDDLLLTGAFFRR